MKKQNFLYLSTLLVSVLCSIGLGTLTQLSRVNSQVAPSAEETKKHQLSDTNTPPIFDPLLSYVPFLNNRSPNSSNIPIEGLPDSPELMAAGLNWPQISISKRISGLSKPVHITHARDSSGRLFIVEQNGRIRIFKNGVLLPTPFLDISSRISCCGEQGLLSVAFPPNYASKQYFYVNYTNVSGDTVVARYRLSNNPDIANANSEEIVLTVDQPYTNHNGGQLAFGADGYLYIGMGDGGSGGDPQNYAQNPASMLGKMLRIDVESGSIPYAIPPNNPFIQTAGYLPEIWAVGFRNPWRFSFDRQTGDLYLGDVGQSQYEEIDFQPASSTGGQNYGWKIMEGAHCYNNPSCNQSGLTLPVFEYDHSQGCSITGGMVYRGQNYLRMHGVYFYADFCSKRLWGLKYDGTAWRNTLLSATPYTITSFGEDQAGNLYLTDFSNGDIYIITSRRSCTLTGGPSDDTLQGTPGNDVICALEGNDTINGGGGNDLIYGDEGNDTINGGGGNDVINAGSGNDLIYGGGGNDTIYGSSGVDAIYANQGDDYLVGGANNDTFNGGIGTDTCIQDGGTGSKTACEK